MSEVKYGELSDWNQADVSGSNDFMRLNEGDNKVRIVTNPYQFVVHWVKDQSGQNRKIRCAIKNCPLCRQGAETQTRWFIGVLDYKSGLPKILEIGSQIFKGIRGYINNPEWDERYEKPWGTILAYDINIQRGPKGTQPLYQVQPSPKMKDLNDEETGLVEGFLKKIDISKFTKPSTPEEVSEKMGLPSEAPETSKPSKGKKPGVSPTLSDDEFDFDDKELEE